jgi:putative acetyltransferase
MKIDIHHAQPQDLDAIHEMFVSSHVIHGTMRIPHHSLACIEKRIEPSDNIVKLVACIDNEVVGYAELATHPDVPRHRHAGEIEYRHCEFEMAGAGGWWSLAAINDRSCRKLDADHSIKPVGMEFE